MKSLMFALLASSLFSSSASAAILYANATNLKTVFAAAKDGDTIKASGTFGSVALQNRTFATRVTLDATNAVFADSLAIKNVHGLYVLKGTFGSHTAYMRTMQAVTVTGSSKIKFHSSTFIGTGTIGTKNADSGMLITSSGQVQVSAANFSNLRTGMAVSSSTDLKLTTNNFYRMTSDGIQIADSHRVLATANMCSGGIPSPFAHPDCIQLWSGLGRPVQSDITLLNNVALGVTQGFVSFTPQWGGGLRISMIGNIVSTSFPQGIACYNCVDSIFTDNVLTTLPGSKWRTSMNIVGGSNNYIANNTIGPKPAPALGLLGTISTLTTAANPGSVSTNYFAGNASNGVGGVPEPSEWFMLTIGFGMVGGFARRRKTTLQHCYA